MVSHGFQLIASIAKLHEPLRIFWSVTWGGAMRRRWSLPWSRLCLGHLWEPLGGQSRRLRSLNVSENGVVAHVAPKSVAFGF